MSSLLRQTRAFDAASLVVRVIYLLFGRLTLQLVVNSDNLSQVRDSAFGRIFFWAHRLSHGTTVDALIIASFAAFLYVTLRPGDRLARILVAYCFLCQLRLEFSFGDVGHASHAFFWVLTVLALAPNWSDGDPSRKRRQRMLQNFFFAQFTVGFFYFLAGAGKITNALFQLFAGQANAFQLTGMSRIVAARLLTGNTSTLLGPLMIQYPALGFLGFWGSVVAEVSALWVVFNPRWQRAWAIVMIMFHLLVTVSMSPNFATNMQLVFLLFLLSPFAKLPPRARA